MNIAIDGPAGAGKSTIAKRVAGALGYIYVDTGAMYRAMALNILRNGADVSDAAAVEAVADRTDVTIAYRDGSQHVLLNGEDVTDLIRTEEVSAMASLSSANGAVRRKLVLLQQALAKKEDVVMDGRDIGTVVLPDAEVKVFLTASARTRALRRYKEDVAKAEAAGQPAPTLEETEAAIIRRDKQDMEREISPLRQAEDAVLVDSSDMTIDEVTETILDLARKAGA